MAQVHRTVTCVTDIGLDLISIPAATEVDLDLRLESVNEGVLVTGTAAGETVGRCARCLEPVAGAVNVFLTELYAYPDSITDQTSDADDIHRIDDDLIDLEQAVIDAVCLDLPSAPLCRVDCAGLCVECGVRLDTAEPDHGHDVIDPRWAKLQERFGAAGPEGVVAD
ncbi:DUF177 domain-containing protein [Williamsia sp. CHRR-6]|nr:DUF177 domain-containing protein [Williamsia sp. CHRR-6]